MSQPLASNPNLSQSIPSEEVGEIQIPIVIGIEGGFDKDKETLRDILYDKTATAAAITATPKESDKVNVKSEKKDSLAILSESLQSKGEPLRLLKWAETIEKAAAGIDGDVVKLKLRIKACEEETEKDCEQRAAAEILRLGLLEKIDLNRHTIEKRETDVAAVRRNLEIAKALHHDLITRKVGVLAAHGYLIDSLHFTMLYRSIGFIFHCLGYAPESGLASYQICSCWP